MANPNAVLIDNVDDYLAPSQACINPLYMSSDSNQNDEKKEEKKSEEKTTANVVVPKARKRRPRVTPSNGEGPAIPSISDAAAPKKKDPIKASMADCLACSGCVTTAETVLLEQNHSLTALKNAMTNSVGQKTLVATISPAVWADLLRHLRVPQSEKQIWQQKLVTALQRVLNISYVMDGNVPLQWSLLEAGEEFCRAYQAAKQQSQQASPQKSLSQIQELDERETPSVAINAKETQYMLPDGATKLVNAGETPSLPPHLPILTSSCPAVVCLVEKSTHPAVRHLSKAKSPMSMAGAWWRHCQQEQQNSVFHLAVMPCHDKKLEASRKDFADALSSLDNNNQQQQQQQQDVDMVLTTQEWLQMMTEFLEGSQEGINNSNSLSNNWSKEESTEKLRDYIASLPPAPAFSSLDNLIQHGNKGSNQEATLIMAPQADNTNGDAMELEGTTKDMGEPMDMEMEATPNGNGNTTTTFTPYGSGGLAEFVFRYAAWRLFDFRVEKVTWNPVVDRTIKAASARMQRVARNRDYYQATLYRHTSGEVSTEERDGSTAVLKFGIAYGLQTVQRVLEPFNKNDNTRYNTNSSSNGDNNNRPFDFIEAMACPSGCLNGGGQLRVADRETPTQTKQRVSSTRDYFATLPSTENMQQGLPPELRLTRFHVVPPLVFSMGAVKGVEVKDTQW